MAASPFLVTPLQDITLLVVPQKTPDRIVRTLRAGGIQVARARTSLDRRYGQNL
jgi:hypothetical protein